MNDTGTKRVEFWLFIASTTLLFRITTFLMEIAASLLAVAHARTASAVLLYIVKLLPVYGPVLAVILAVLLARALEPRLNRLPAGRQRILLVIVAVLALLPWQLQIRLATRPVPLHGPATGVPSGRP